MKFSVRAFVVVSGAWQVGGMADDAKLPAKGGRPKNYRLSERMLAALTALSEGRASSVAEAAELSGLTERAIHYSLKKESARRWLRERGLLPEGRSSRPTESRPKPLRPLDDGV